MDYAESLPQSGTYLYEELLYLKDKDPLTAHDPKRIKKELFRKEKDRILTDRIPQNARLFHFSETISLDSRDLEFEAKNLEHRQQDAKDFFVSLEANLDEWFDVYSLFKYLPFTYTECRECGFTSHQAHPNTYKSAIFLDIPQGGLSMAEHVRNHLNLPSIVQDEWICSNDASHNSMGCNSYVKIKDINEVQFLVFVTERLKAYMKGSQVVEWIDYTEVDAGGNVQVLDSNGVRGTLMLIAVIHHWGVVVGHETSGHYMADILDPQTQQWYFTSDDQTPTLVNQPSKRGYIYIYKKL